MGSEPLQLIIDGAWVAGYGVGANEIDAEHRRLFRMLDRMRAAYAARQEKFCLLLIKEFAEAIRSHFAHEEAIFMGLSYPNANRHCAQHAVLALRVDAILEVAGRVPVARRVLADLIDGLAVVVMIDHLTLDLELRQSCASPPAAGVAAR